MKAVIASLLFVVSMTTANPPLQILLKTTADDGIIGDLGCGGLGCGLGLGLGLGLKDDGQRWIGQAGYENGKTIATLDNAWDRKESRSIVLLAAAPKYQTVQIVKSAPKVNTYVASPEPAQAEYVAKTLGSIHKAPQPAGPAGAAKISTYHINTEPAAGLVSKNGGY